MSPAIINQAVGSPQPEFPFLLISISNNSNTTQHNCLPPTALTNLNQCRLNKKPTQPKPANHPQTAKMVMMMPLQPFVGECKCKCKTGSNNKPKKCGKPTIPGADYCKKCQEHYPVTQ